MRVLRGLAMCFVCMVLGAGAVRAQSGQATSGAGEDFVVRPGDLLRIRIWPEATMNGEFPVETTGTVNLPGIGEVPAAGLTLATLRHNLTERYTQLMKSPVVSIIPVFHVSVVGGVASPGYYQVTPTENLLDVISRAGGFTRRAKPDEMRIVRYTGETRDVHAREGLAATSAAIAMQSGDRVIVPERGSFALAPVVAVVQFAATVVVLVRTLTR